MSRRRNRSRFAPICAGPRRSGQTPSLAGLESPGFAAVRRSARSPSVGREGIAKGAAVIRISDRQHALAALAEGGAAKVGDPCSVTTKLTSARGVLTGPDSSATIRLAGSAVDGSAMIAAAPALCEAARAKSSAPPRHRGSVPLTTSALTCPGGKKQR
jgi:hypothetical protein